MKPIDFLAIGDIVVDAFIKLKDPSIHCHLNHETKELCIPFGEKVPFDSVEIANGVGNGPNAAVSAARLGLKSAAMTDIGNDQYGADCLAALKKDGVVTKYVSKHRGKKTNYHYVLWYGDERTILVKHTDFGYKFSAPWKNPRWVYITSLSADSLDYQLDVAKWLEKNPDIKLAFQPGTFQINAGREKLTPLYKRSDVFFCNVEEARRILGIPSGEVKDLLKGMRELGPKTVVITDGPNGAYAYDGNEAWFMPTYPDPKPPFERTGAGDAFASTFSCALALGKTLAEALAWAPINSMNVVQHVGAQKGLLTRTELEKYLKNAPAEYKARKI
ncbi:MAG TPA: carbohydrate kinase family protein [Candidatus Nanoarchaeia archaeon]|nr:carbohydrate kinase family protein [Candidatus Nanoarchaeia archaeon]